MVAYGIHSSHSKFLTDDVAIVKIDHRTESASTDSTHNISHTDRDDSYEENKEEQIQSTLPNITTHKLEDDYGLDMQNTYQSKPMTEIHELDFKGLCRNVSSTIQGSVSFHPNVRVREYPVGIVESPSVSIGVGIGLIGECKNEYICSIHDMDHVPQAADGNLLIPPKERETMLHNQGISWKEIHSAVIISNHNISQRRRKKNKTKDKRWKHIFQGWNEYLSILFSWTPSQKIQAVGILYINDDTIMSNANQVRQLEDKRVERSNHSMAFR